MIRFFASHFVSFNSPKNRSNHFVLNSNRGNCWVSGLDSYGVDRFYECMTNLVGWVKAVQCIWGNGPFVQKIQVDGPSKMNVFTTPWVPLLGRFWLPTYFQLGDKKVTSNFSKCQVLFVRKLVVLWSLNVIREWPEVFPSVKYFVWKGLWWILLGDGSLCKCLTCCNTDWYH